MFPVPRAETRPTTTGSWKVTIECTTSAENGRTQSSWKEISQHGPPNPVLVFKTQGHPQHASATGPESQILGGGHHEVGALCMHGLWTVLKINAVMRKRPREGGP